MRRVLVVLALVSGLGVTGAFGSTFDVGADDLGSFQYDVEVDVPNQTLVYYLVGEHGLAPQLDDVLLDDRLGAGEYHEWETPALPGGLAVDSVQVELLVYTNGATGGSATTTARLYECAEALPSTADCVQLGVAAVTWSGNTVQSLTFPPLSGPTGDEVRPGYRLRLRIANEHGGEFNVQWGKANPTRDSRIVISPPVAP